ncbi:hypothetical protein PENSPDRAFT_694607 [Peniophora sp. CONT]|nr:hypothetical protein PENSPDRAFT_694607 [Peniophora sp. CONT]
MSHEPPALTLEEIKVFLAGRLPNVFTGDWRPWTFHVHPEHSATYPANEVCLPGITVGNSYLYVGSRARRRCDSIDTHEDAPSEASQRAAPINRNAPAHGNGPHAFDLGPDDPHWSVDYIPGRKIEAWHMQALAVVSREDDDGRAFTFVIGYSYWSWDDLYEDFPVRAPVVRAPFIHSHPSELLLTDDLQVARAHHFIARVRPLFLANARPIIPPPVLKTPVVLVIPGFLYNLNKGVSRISRKPLEFIAHPDIHPVNCDIHGCQRGGCYDRNHDAVRYCTRCDKWWHEGCLPLGDFDAMFAGGSWRQTLEGEEDPDVFEARPVRRAPREEPHVKHHIARGLWYRSPLPIDTWERAMVPFVRTYRRHEFQNVRNDSLWQRFIGDMLKSPGRFSGPKLTAGIVDRVVRKLFPPAAPEEPRSLVFACPECHAPV